MSQQSIALEKLAARSPKWTIALLLVGISTGAFVLWWLTADPTKSPENLPLAEESPPEPHPETGLGRQPSNPPSSTDDSEATSSGTDSPIQGPIEIDPKTMFLAGRSLYKVESGEVQVVKEDWLERSPTLRDQITYLPDPNVLVISHSDGSLSVFRNTGERIGELSLPEGRFDGYAALDYLHVVYLREGNIWRGEIDWQTAQIVNEKQITFGISFHGNPFRGRLLAGTEKALLYRHHILGMLHVNLETGATDTGQLPSNATVSPNGQLLIGDIPGNPPQLIVFDVNSTETLSLDIPVKIPQNGFTWLDATRAALILSNEIQIYDHDEKKLTTVYQSSGTGFPLRLIAKPSHDGNFLMLEDENAGIINLNTVNFETTRVLGPPANHIEFLEGGSYVLASDVGTSEQHGTWLGHFGEEQTVRLSPIPFRLKTERNPHLPAGTLTLPNGATFVKLEQGRYFISGTTSLLPIGPAEQPIFRFRQPL